MNHSIKPEGASATVVADWMPDWSAAPPGWDWLAQDGNGCWYWYRTRPVSGWAGDVWRSNSRHQQLAGRGRPNPAWFNSLQHRPAP